MNNNERHEIFISNFQSFAIILIGIGYEILILNFIPLHGFLQYLVLCLSAIKIIPAIKTFCCRYLHFYRDNYVSWKSIIITFLVFLLIPAMMQVLHYVNKQAYLKLPPNDDIISVKITVDQSRVGGGGSIGNDWKYLHYINKTPFVSGDVVQLYYNKKFTITSRFIEQDSIDDVGEKKSRQYSFASNSKDNIITITQKVHVVEQGGRRNAGAYADFQVKYTLERIVPPKAYLSFWNTLFFENYYVAGILTLLFTCQVALICYVIFDGTNKKQIAFEIKRISREQIRLSEEKIRKEHELLEEKNNFLNYLGGQSIRSVAKVPDNITFINGLPRDNNNSLYGSYTVYITRNGTCFHQNRGCCSARYEKHYFNAIKLYRPCSKCCTKQLVVPEWYKAYKDLKSKANKYGISDES